MFYICFLWCVCAALVVVGATGIQGVALIRTSPQLLWHFHSGGSLGSLFIKKKKKKPSYMVMHYSQHRCQSDPLVTSAHKTSSCTSKPDASHSSAMACNSIYESGCENRCLRIMSFFIFLLLFGHTILPDSCPACIQLFSIH